jgi:hypothetical protein
MASETLKAMLNHWTGPVPHEEGVINLPFNVEEFCRENDAQLKAARILLLDAESHFANGSDDDGVDLWRRISDFLAPTSQDANYKPTTKNEGVTISSSDDGTENLLERLKPKRLDIKLGECSSLAHCFVGESDRCECGENARSSKDPPK